MRRWSAILLLFVLLFSMAGSAQAQAAVEFESMTTMLWPEYDRPEMLVIYRITLSAATRLPAQVDLRIPNAAGEPYNVAVEEDDGQLYTLNYTSAQDGDWLVLSVTTPNPKLQVEYYDPGLTVTGDRREYEFRWAGDAAINNLTVQVQQPKTATNLQVAPDMGTWDTGPDGLRYYTENVGSVPAGTPVSIKINYTKSDDVLSVPDQAALQPSQPIGPSTSQLQMQEALPFVIGGVGVALIVGGGLWFWLISRKRQVEPTRARHASSSRSPAGEEGGDTYCHQCGKRASKDDVFCRTCGTRLRHE